MGLPIREPNALVFLASAWAARRSWMKKKAWQKKDVKKKHKLW